VLNLGEVLRRKQVNQLKKIRLCHYQNLKEDKELDSELESRLVVLLQIQGCLYLEVTKNLCST
jgi:hypothetical protein